MGFERAKWRGRVVVLKRREEPAPAAISAAPLVVEQLNLDRYPQEHRDLTALVLGDPAPGRSALDQRNRNAQDHRTR